MFTELFNVGIDPESSIMSGNNTQCNNSSSSCDGINRGCTNHGSSCSGSTNYKYNGSTCSNLSS